MTKKRKRPTQTDQGDMYVLSAANIYKSAMRKAQIKVVNRYVRGEIDWGTTLMLVDQITAEDSKLIDDPLPVEQ